jgi:hypothetical protein
MSIAPFLSTLSIDELAGYLSAVFGLWLIGFGVAIATVWIRLQRTDGWSTLIGWRRRMEVAERLAIRTDRLVLSFSIGLVLALIVGEALG